MRRLLTTGLALVLATGAGAALDPPAVTKLPRPSWNRASAPAPSANVRLTLVSSRTNSITDVRAWFARNKLDLALDRVPGGFGNGLPLHPLPAGTPSSFRGKRLIRAIRQPRRLLLVYGRDFASGRYLIGRTAGRPQYGFDFLSFAYAPRIAPGEREFVFQTPTWAVEAGGALYVSHSHSTYARSSGGLNGYVTAIDIARRTVRWRSRPLVANAETFVLAGDVIVTGYGFAREPDYLYLLDRETGRVLQRLRVPSRAEYIVRKGNILHVRTYDRDLVVRLAKR